MPILYRYDSLNLSSITKDAFDVVTAVNDLSGNGYHLAAAGAVTHGSRSVNNHPVFDFSANQQLKNTSIPTPSALTVFIQGAFDVEDFNAFIWGTALWNSINIRRVTPNLQITAAVGGPANLSDSLITITADGTTSTLRVNGVQIATGAHAANLGTGVVLGNDTTSTTSPFDGWIRAVEAYDSVLTSQEILAVEATLLSSFADTSVKVQMLPPTGFDFINMVHTEPTLPADSILKGDTFAINDQVAFQTTATHTDTTTGTVVLDEFAVPTITGTSATGTWTFDYWIKDANGDNTVAYTASVVAA